MIKPEKNASLLPYNTFGINAHAKYLSRITTVDDLRGLIKTDLFKNEPYYILGGGSNILFTKDFEGLIIKDDLKGRKIVDEDEYHITLKVAAGENWHEFVLHAVKNNWGGIENLSLIPGTMGAAPMQNIGAYGVEVKSVIEKVEMIDLLTGEEVSYDNEECQFGYRESIFKGGGIKKFFISSVTLRLTKKNHQLHTQYGALSEALKELKSNVGIKNISDAVIRIRQSKLPDPTVVGNAGSFFKNPTIPYRYYLELKKEYDTIPSYAVDNETVKVPAGWLIEMCGWKGKKINHIGVHPLQALVIVNYGGGSGEEILQLATKIQNSVMEKFGIQLTPEVNIL